MVGAGAHPASPCGVEQCAGQPRLPASWLGQLRHYRNLHETEARLERLLRDFPFGTMRSLIQGAPLPYLTVGTQPSASR
jgi:hypothetical protein